MKFGNIVCISFLFILFGCGAGVKFAVSVPPNNDAVRLYVFRPSSPPILFKPTIYINDIKIAELSNKGYFDLELQPGTYNIRAYWPMFSGVVGNNQNVEFKVISGKVYYVMISTTMNVYGMYTPGVVKNITQVIDADSSMPMIKECGLVEKYADAGKLINPK